MRILKFISLISFLFFGCSDDKEFTYSFKVQNNFSEPIIVYSSVMVYSQQLDKQQEIAYTDKINSNSNFELRKKTVWDDNEDIVISDFFEKIQIYKEDQTKSALDAFDITKWEKVKISDDNIQYTLMIDSLCFFP